MRKRQWGGDSDEDNVDVVVIELRQDVRVIRREGVTALVEWTDSESNLRRCFIPANEIDDVNTVKSSVLDKGIDYGIDWLALVTEFKFTPAKLGNELRRAGIWTAADAMSNPNAVFAAIQRSIGLDVSTVQRLARKMEGCK